MHAIEPYGREWNPMAGANTCSHTAWPKAGQGAGGGGGKIYCKPRTSPNTGKAALAAAGAAEAAAAAPAGAAPRCHAASGKPPSWEAQEGPHPGGYGRNQGRGSCAG